MAQKVVRGYDIFPWAARGLRSRAVGRSAEVVTPPCEDGRRRFESGRPTTPRRAEVLTVLRPDLPQWRRIRAESLPLDVVDAAAKARAAGDWRGAAALAGCDVDVPLQDAALEDDLRHLSVDLLRWHLPRHRGGMSTLQPMVSAVLAPRAGADTAPLLR